MAKKLECEDGFIVRGETDEEFWENAQAHLRDAHPELVGKVTRDDLLAQATEV